MQAGQVFRAPLETAGTGNVFFDAEHLGGLRRISHAGRKKGG
jgi:hypothetical protein